MCFHYYLTTHVKSVECFRLSHRIILTHFSCKRNRVYEATADIPNTFPFIDNWHTSCCMQYTLFIVHGSYWIHTIVRFIYIINVAINSKVNLQHWTFWHCGFLNELQSNYWARFNEGTSRQLQQTHHFIWKENLKLQISIIIQNFLYSRKSKCMCAVHWDKMRTTNIHFDRI